MWHADDPESFCFMLWLAEDVTLEFNLRDGVRTLEPALLLFYAENVFWSSHFFLNPCVVMSPPIKWSVETRCVFFFIISSSTSSLQQQQLLTFSLFEGKVGFDWDPKMTLVSSWVLSSSSSSKILSCDSWFVQTLFFSTNIRHLLTFWKCTLLFCGCSQSCHSQRVTISIRILWLSTDSPNNSITKDSWHLPTQCSEHIFYVNHHQVCYSEVESKLLGAMRDHDWRLQIFTAMLGAEFTVELEAHRQNSAGLSKSYPPTQFMFTS